MDELTNTAPLVDPACWLPFTANRAFLQQPRLLNRAQGMHYWTPDGRPVLDGTAGLWCVNAGHCRPEISAAIAQQAAEMDFAPTFEMGHPLVFSLAKRLIQWMPPTLNHVFFTNSGSESADTALKIARACHFNRGEPKRTLFIGREKAYHGVGFGGLSVGGLPRNKEAFGPLLEADFLPHTLNQDRNRFNRGLPEWGEDPSIYEQEGLLTHGARLAAHFEEALHSLRGLPHVIDIRNIGMMAAIEMASRPDAAGARGRAALHSAFEKGLLIRTTGDTIALSPPLIIQADEIDEIVDTLHNVLRLLK